MAKGRWTKYSKINQYILQILNINLEHLTTNELKRRLLEKYNIRICWPTINKYLNELAESGHLRRIGVNKKHEFHIWTLKGVGEIGANESIVGSQSEGTCFDE